MINYDASRYPPTLVQAKINQTSTCNGGRAGTPNLTYECKQLEREVHVLRIKCRVDGTCRCTPGVEIIPVASVCVANELRLS